MTSLLRDGYLLIPQLIDIENLELLTLGATEVLECLKQSDRQSVISLGSIGKVETNHRLLEFALSSNFIQRLSSYIQSTLLFHVGVVFSKPPSSPPTFWHQDFIGWSEPVAYVQEHSHLQILVYLTDTNITNGALRLIPGSHVNRHLLHDRWLSLLRDFGADARAATSILRSYEDSHSWAYDSCEDQISLPVKAGDVVVIDTRILHSAFGNSSNKERPLITLGYFSDFQSYSSNFRAGISSEVRGQMESEPNSCWSSSIDNLALDLNATSNGTPYRNSVAFS